VPAETATAQIRTAFLGRAKQWHPDKLDPELRASRDLVTKVFSRMTEAHQVLTNAEQRAEYDRMLAEPGDSPEEHAEVQKVLRAAATFQKAEVLVKRSEWTGALEAAKSAHEEDPEQAEYDALYAWLLARQLDANDTHGFAGPLQRLMRAVKAQPNNMRVRLYRARVFRAMGKVNEAMRDYRSVTDTEPNNVEAQRELRLHRMRTGPNPDEETSGGLFGKLFKK
jgi:curved DNA-binding protein CbpA